MSRTLKAAVLIFAVLLASFVMPAQAVTNVYKLSDYFRVRAISGDVLELAFELPTKPLLTLYNGSTLKSIGSPNGTWFDVDPGNGFTEPNFIIYPLGSTASSAGASNVIDISDFVSDALVSFSTSFSVRFKFGYFTPNGSSKIVYSTYYTLLFYSADGSYISSNTPMSAQGSITVPAVDDSGTSAGLFPLTAAAETHVPKDAVYVAPVIHFSIETHSPDMNLIVSSCQVTYNSASIKTRENMIVKQSVLMEEITSQLEDANDQLGDLNDKADQILQQPEQEKQEASSGGQDAADQLAGAIPDQSQGFMDAIQDLVSSMSYDGTEAKLTFPSITLPAIPGVMPSYKLSEPYDVDFGVWIQRMPENLMRLVQVLGTLALVVYSFKELYGMISYAMTLKGGGSDG